MQKVQLLLLPLGLEPSSRVGCGARILTGRAESVTTLYGRGRRERWEQLLTENHFSASFSFSDRVCSTGATSTRTRPSPSLSDWWTQSLPRSPQALHAWDGKKGWEESRCRSSTSRRWTRRERGSLGMLISAQVMAIWETLAQLADGEDKGRLVQVSRSS